MIHLRLNFEEGLEREYVYHVVPAMQNEKVKAGVLLYALLMAAIFSLLLQFYLHRQGCGETDLKDESRSPSGLCFGAIGS